MTCNQVLYPGSPLGWELYAPPFKRGNLVAQGKSNLKAPCLAFQPTYPACSSVSILTNFGCCWFPASPHCSSATAHTMLTAAPSLHPWPGIQGSCVCHTKAQSKGCCEGVKNYHHQSQPSVCFSHCCEALHWTFYRNINDQAEISFKSGEVRCGHSAYTNEFGKDFSLLLCNFTFTYSKFHLLFSCQLTRDCKILL